MKTNLRSKGERRRDGDDGGGGGGDGAGRKGRYVNKAEIRQLKTQRANSLRKGRDARMEST